MYLRLIVGIILVGVSMVLSGCNGARESNEVAYIIAMGLDKAEEKGMVTVTYKIAKPSVEGSKEPGGDAFLISNTAVTIAESLNLLNSIIAAKPSLSHTKVLVLGEELSRQGLTDIWGSLFRYREYRGSMFVLIARGTAKQFLEESKPTTNMSPAKYFETVLISGEESGYFLRTSFHQFYHRLKSRSSQPYATLVAINPQSGKGQIAVPKVPGGKINGYIAGEIPREGGTSAEFAGTAIFSGDKMVGMLSTTETRMLSMLLGAYHRGFLSVEDPLDPKSYVNVYLRLGSSPKIKATLEDGHPLITVKILLEGEFTNITSGINYEEDSYLKLVESQINNVLQEEMVNFIKHTQELNSDVAGFGYYMHPLFSNMQDFLDYNWNEKYNQAEVHVEINTKIRRTGLMLRTVPMEIIEKGE
ncbi:Ger(x)C family spore germination protein [Pelosinus sp. IPA-1]|uniref:Ger(x)C family spore germination protein n=1 Tax=Pelosinus sp. IPA-1 TaxID=3029569 RepID=UPI0024361F2E|nr:Ger(x)C family spore germination protein [Pelosinus sp. IPA-1]GMA99104.1 hypothetical protein PIPA1_19040 [Pelosinus sp. IPA-1]